MNFRLGVILFIPLASSIKKTAVIDHAIDTAVLRDHWQAETDLGLDQALNTVLLTGLLHSKKKSKSSPILFEAIATEEYLGASPRSRSISSKL